MDGKQLRAARGLLGWTVQELATRSGVGTATITRAEAGQGRLIARTSAKLQSTLEEGGVKFIPQNGGGPGVRLRDPT